MERQIGNPNSKFWLLGDSEPDRWKKYLDGPLDPRHPIRHNIWTSVLDVVQDRLYRDGRIRMDTSQIYIRNAVGSVKHRPVSTVVEWPNETKKEVADYRALRGEFRPIMICSFGSFAFEFARRALCENPPLRFSGWSTKGLGDEFRGRARGFHPDRSNLLPLLHRSISGGRFLQSHRAFCGPSDGNYFTYVGEVIAGMLLSSRDKVNAWI